MAKRKGNTILSYANYANVIILRRNGDTHTVYIDVEDVPKIAIYTWSVDIKTTGHIYVYTLINHKKVYMHRYIMEPSANMQVDHINNNTLDNQKKNLRQVLPYQNCQNVSGARKDNKSSSVRGVHHYKSRNKYEVKLEVNKKKIHVGYFKTLEEAETAAINARAELLEFSKEAAQPKEED